MAGNQRDTAGGCQGDCWSCNTYKTKDIISDGTCSLIKQEREEKQNNPQKYKRLKPTVQWKLREDKNKEIERQCEVLEIASKRGNTRKLFQATHTLTRKFQQRLDCIQSAPGANVTEPVKTAEHWHEYCEELFADEERNKPLLQYVKQPPPLWSEVYRAIHCTASGKSAGPYEVPVELLKEGGDATDMHTICLELWESGQWPQEWIR